ncbi:MAG: thioredoxin-dependent thiol peroxidase [Gemmatimonadota bacterium]
MPRRRDDAGRSAPGPAATLPDVGSPAPPFALASDQGGTIALTALRGQPVVLYFYPKDDTPGCTTQACDFRDHWREVQRRGAVVLGVSPDGLGSHAKFRRKYRLPFPLLADEDHAVAAAYGVWGEKSLFGYRYQGIRRTTFVISPDGVIARVFQRVRPKGHAAQVLAALDAL